MRSERHLRDLREVRPGRRHHGTAAARPATFSVRMPARRSRPWPPGTFSAVRRSVAVLWSLPQRHAPRPAAAALTPRPQISGASRDLDSW